MPGCFVFWVSRKGLGLALVLDGILYVCVYLLGLGVLVLGGIVGVVQWVWGCFRYVVPALGRMVIITPGLCGYCYPGHGS